MQASRGHRFPPPATTRSPPVPDPSPPKRCAPTRPCPPPAPASIPIRSACGGTGPAPECGSARASPSRAKPPAPPATGVARAGSAPRRCRDRRPAAGDGCRQRAPPPSSRSGSLPAVLRQPSPPAAHPRTSGTRPPPCPETLHGKRGASSHPARPDRRYAQRRALQDWSSGCCLRVGALDIESPMWTGGRSMPLETADRKLPIATADPSLRSPARVQLQNPKAPPALARQSDVRRTTGAKVH
ncbi:protein of unknown function [Hyphomicrobium sp. 1Nfss2.1]